ncbi:hypothetical protein L1987_18140 [Smallanthus sonchifolius]|uniref:Uncharacterized protein n=1 Tax=Smallanthus sonchifolius TaxID=185202 RepID=A0ACB9J0F2_9ASTR|nr:hypothetical protein L1987_18140 [Smallanthus sonchifolius]
MADPIVFAFFRMLIEKLVSEASKNFARYKGINADIKKWERWLKEIQGVLTDSSQKEMTDDSVKEWLNDFQPLAYDIDDLLDGWVAEAMHPEFTHESEATTSMVRKLIPTCCTNFSPRIKMLGELDSINARFKDLVKQKK